MKVWYSRTDERRERLNFLIGTCIEIIALFLFITATICVFVSLS